MITNLLKEIFFVPEVVDNLRYPVRRKYFLKSYVRRFLRALFWLIYYGYPSRKLKLIGITGTDGKTTVSNLVYHILTRAGKKVSVISTIYGKIGEEVFDTGFHVTTPAPKQMQGYFKQAVSEGSEYFVVEATSHGLDQFRVLGCRFEVGILTNITHEHLDYHINFENYLAVKGKLFQQSKTSVLNYDDPSFRKIKKFAGRKIITYGLSPNAKVNLKNTHFKTLLPGEYNKYNILAAVACARSLGIDEKIIHDAVADFNFLSGRMEEVKNNLGVKIIVDFAHTPNALEQALRALRIQTKGRLIAVFGAASERDIEKRPMMGRISAELADVTVLTDEDPRFENRDKIIEGIAKSAIKAGATEGKSLFREPDRAKAIELAIKMAKKGDTVGIFGKGHEKSMNYQGKELPWSDQKAALDALGLV